MRAARRRERFADLINDVTRETLVGGFLMTAAAKHFGRVHVGSEDAFRVMPADLGMELRWNQDRNRLILNGDDPVPAPDVSPKKKANRKS